jgi:hypothetical protein
MFLYSVHAADYVVLGARLQQEGISFSSSAFTTGLQDVFLKGPGC